MNWMNKRWIAFISSSGSYGLHFCYEHVAYVLPSTAFHWKWSTLDRNWVFELWNFLHGFEKMPKFLSVTIPLIQPSCSRHADFACFWSRAAPFPVRPPTVRPIDPHQLASILVRQWRYIPMNYLLTYCVSASQATGKI